MKLNKSLFKKINIATIIAVYFLILVGGIVRSVGAGMGCPDWPKCFGQYAPPTSESQLPADYKAVFREERLKKNARFASFLGSLGFDKLSDKISNDPTIKVEEDFNVIKAWTEYINRLIGVLIGFLIVLNMIFSFSYVKENKMVPVVAVLSFVLVVFQGWIGSLVVSTNLLPGFVTFHMALALLLVAMLIWIFHKITTFREEVPGDKAFSQGSVILFLLFIPQILLGTQVRESIDQLIVSGMERSAWIANVAWTFYIHRSFSLILTAVLGYMIYRAFKKDILLSTKVGFVLLFSGVLIFMEVAGGAVMTYFSVPAFLQPVHLLVASLMFGLFYYLILLTRSSKVV